MNRFRLPPSGGDDRSAPGRAGSGSTPSANPTTHTSGGSSGVHISQDFESDAPAAGTSSSRGATRAPLPSPPLPSSQSSSPLPSSASSAEPAPWLSLSSAGLPADGSTGKRRMLLDADVRCEENGPSFFNSESAASVSNERTESRGVRLGNRSTRGRQKGCDVGDDGHSGEPFLRSKSPPTPSPSPTPTPPLPSGLPSSSSSPVTSCPSSLFLDKGKQREQRSPQPAARRNGNARYGHVDGSAGGSGRSAPRGGGQASSTEHPSSPAPPTGRGRRQQPVKVKGATATPSPSFSSSPSARLDTIMEDHDPFDELSRAEELALATAAASIRTAKHRQLANREGIAITHSRLLQGDNGFVIRADADKLLDGTRSLLQELGLEVDKDTAEPMEEEEEEEVAEPRPYPLQQVENSDPLDEASSASKQGAQVPPQPLQAQTNPTELPSSQYAARRGGGGGAAGSRGPPPVGVESRPPPPVREVRAPAAAAGEGEAGDAMLFQVFDGKERSSPNA